MSPLDKLTNLAGAENAHIRVYYFGKYTKTWQVEFEQEFKGQTVKLSAEDVKLTVAIDALHDKVMSVGKFGIKSVIPKMIEYKEEKPTMRPVVDDTDPF